MRLRSIALCISLPLALGALLGRVTPSAAPQAATAAALDAQALSKQLSAAVAKGDTPGVVALVVDRDRVLYEGAAGKLDVGHNVAMPVDAVYLDQRRGTYKPIDFRFINFNFFLLMQ